MRVLTAQHVLATVDPTSRLWAAAADIEAEVFELAGYAPAQQIRDEYRHYDDSTTFIVAVERSQAVGCVRLIHWSDRGFKTLSEIEHGRLERFPTADVERYACGTTFEVGTMALRRDAIGDLADEGRVAMALYGGSIGYARQRQIEHFLASWDAGFWQRFLRTFGAAAGQALGPPVWYLGSPTLPAVVAVDDWLRSASLTRRAMVRALEHNADRLQIVLEGDASLLSEEPDRARPAQPDRAARSDAAPSPR
jgi:hypothetical protein